MQLFLSQLINGLSNSAEMFLVVIGMVIIFGMLDVCNMAHGEFIMVGAYTTVVLYTRLHLPFAVSLVGSFIMAAVIGMALEFFVIRRLYGKVAETLLSTFALTYVFEQICRAIFGPEGQSVAVPLAGRLTIGEITIPYYDLFLILMAGVVLAVTLLLLYRTRFGVQLRAVTQNRSMTECLGINTRHIDRVTFAYGCGLAGLAGGLIAPVASVEPGMGGTYIVNSFMIAILGGVNSIIGSLFGSFVFEESETVMSGYMSQVTASLLVFMMVIIVMRFKPYGLFASKDRR